jgi:hypothetical protein
MMSALSPVTNIFSSIGSKVSETFGAVTPLGEFFTHLMPLAVTTLIDGVTLLIQFVETLSGFIGATLATLFDAVTHFFSDPKRRDMDLQQLFNPKEIAKTWSEIWNKTGSDIDAGAKVRAKARADAKAAADAASTPEKRDKGTLFLNNRFDITMDFAEGFDPDRIAVAFGRGVSDMGNKRLASNLAHGIG